MYEVGVKRVSASGMTLISIDVVGRVNDDVQHYVYCEKGQVIKAEIASSDWARFQLYDDYIEMQMRIARMRKQK